MKKIIAVLTILAAMSLTGCQSTEEDAVQANGTPAGTSETSDTAEVSAPEVSEVSAADITSAVMAEIEISSPAEKTIDDIGAFYDVDTSSVTDMSVFICGSGAYPDELAVFRFSDADSAKAGAEAVKKRLESQTELYTDYTPDEVYKLEDANIIEKDNWVILTVCSDNAGAAEIINGLI